MYDRRSLGCNVDSKAVDINLFPSLKLSMDIMSNESVFADLLFASLNTGSRVFYTLTTHVYHSMPETVEHRNIRFKTKLTKDKDKDVLNDLKVSKFLFSVYQNFIHTWLLQKHDSSEFTHVERAPQTFHCQKTELPSFLFCLTPKVGINPRNNVRALKHFFVFKVVTLNCVPFCSSRRAAYNWLRHVDDWSWNSLNYHWSAATHYEVSAHRAKYIHPKPMSPVERITPRHGWSLINIPGI